MKWVVRILTALVLLGVAVWLLRPGVGEIAFDADAIGDDPVAYLAAQESRFDDIVEGTQKRVVWAGDPGARTDWVVVYVHGFSASSEEIRPVPDQVAAALGANLYFTRLEGHGRDGAAMAESSAEAWLRDFDEGLAIARRLGDRVLVMSASTGGTIAALASARGRDVDAQVMVSPNFGVQAAGAFLLTLPGARSWVPLLVGETRSFEAENPAHAKYWTTRYPTEAVVPMALSVRAAKAAALQRITTPALVIFSEDDQVVRPEATRAAMARWGGPVTLEPVSPPPGNAPSNHVLAGDILSPDMTAPVTDMILDWVRALP
ncbi:alpha/beta hydrolase [Maribius pontilimi]|uniref:Alpha/beta hydrolase n=1 Tax=Palleronia pontilimi TaxID=1964209 RepID=A0A934I993_9RHOB|nr:alpha/beta hydrolase [Palleronia pontilimi]MBJ3762743.1 alpha/beta hydrolase [Palleronia pontilimi]